MYSCSQVVGVSIFYSFISRIPGRFREYFIESLFSPKTWKNITNITNEPGQWNTQIFFPAKSRCLGKTQLLLSHGLSFEAMRNKRMSNCRDKWRGWATAVHRCTNIIAGEYGKLSGVIVTYVSMKMFEQKHRTEVALCCKKAQMSVEYLLSLCNLYYCTKIWKHWSNVESG